MEERLAGGGLFIKRSARGKGNIKACRGHRVKAALDGEGTD